MNAKTPIVLIEDDDDDAEIFSLIVSEIDPSKAIKRFTIADDVLDYLDKTSDEPFLIICNLRMAQKEMIYLKKTIDAQPKLRRKSIPFIYYFQDAQPETVEELYTNMNIQGVFKKTGDLNVLRSMFKTIIAYWESCMHPKSYRG